MRIQTRQRPQQEVISAPMLRGKRGSGVTGHQEYLAVVMKETHLLAETSPAEGGGETPRLLSAFCLPIS